MIFLDLYTLPNSTSGIDSIAQQTVSTVPVLVPMTLIFIFFTVFLGGISRQKARTGTSDYAMWAVVASISTFMITLLMTLGTGILAGTVGLTYLIIVTLLTIFCGVWLFLDRKQSEI